MTAKSGDDNTAVERIGRRDSHRRINNRGVCPGCMSRITKTFTSLGIMPGGDLAPDLKKKEGKKKENPRGKAPQEFEQRAARRA